MKIFLLAAFAYLLLSGTPAATAQPNDKGPRREDMKELRTSMRAWFERSVQPTLLDWKRQYDASLSPEDLATLNGLRAEAKQHAQHPGKLGFPGHPGRPEHPKGMKRDDEGKDRDSLKDAHKAARRDFFERLKPIAERSKDKLRSMFDNGKDQINTWREEAKAIVDAWRQAHPDADGRVGPHVGMGLFPLGHGEENRGKRAAIRFMLWDGTAPAGDEASAFESAPMGVTEHNQMSDSPLHVSPLPTNTSVVLSMDKMPNGAATIELFTMDGVLVKSIPVTISGNALNETIDISSLSTGSYMASVNTTSGRRSSQIVVSR